MNKDEIRIGQRVRYVPAHAHGDENHPDCESGIVRSFNMSGEPFVVYDNKTRGVMRTLEDAANWTAACTYASDLVPLSSEDSDR